MDRINKFIEIDDLLNPKLSKSQIEIVEMMNGIPVDLREDTVLEAAQKGTGLTDFGDQGFKERLRVQLLSVSEDQKLNNLGRASIFADCVRYASNRLLFEDLLKRHPEILNEKIANPIIVAGLPRSGTTHLLNLLASDKRLSSVPYWESREPLPLPEEKPTWDDSDPRYQRCQAAWEQQDAMLPLLKAMHDMSPDHVHEELELENLDFSSYNLEWLAHVPRWRDYYYSHDQTPHYAYMKNVLKALQWLRGGERWVLKCPQHMEQLPVLLKTFPDASVVLTHRDPVAVIASIVTMLAYGQRLKYSQVDPKTLVEYWTDRIERLLKECVRDRFNLQSGKIMDLPFQEFMDDDLGAVKKIYQLAQLEFNDTSARKLSTYLDNNPRGKYGRVVYHLERDFGVSTVDLQERFLFYYKHYQVREIY